MSLYHQILKIFYKYDCIYTFILDIFQIKFIYYLLTVLGTVKNPSQIFALQKASLIRIN